uniref:Predicted gene 10267 n=1 Tax=Peromyscus maniculatus bairdii TaxID=230844 RepID=A0A8C8TJX3_PERMB
MLVFSRVIYIILSLLLYSESTFIGPALYRRPTMCGMYSPLGICTREYYPVCGTNDRTYFNKCAFCIAYRESNGKIKFKHYGKC